MLSIVILILIFPITNEAHLFKNTFPPTIWWVSRFNSHLYHYYDVGHFPHVYSHLYFLFWEMLLPILVLQFFHY